VFVGCISSLETCPFKSVPFLNDVLFLLLNFWSSSCILDTRFLGGIQFAQIFFYSVSCLFAFLIMSLMQKNFDFQKVQFIFSLVAFSA
jgi:hypothetical protein